MDGPKFKMSNFDIYVVHSAFGAILGDPKFGSFHVGSPHLMAVTGHSWLTLVVNCKNELCSPSNNTISKAFWQKRVLQEQKISCCEGIYILTKHQNNGNDICLLIPLVKQLSLVQLFSINVFKVGRPNRMKFRTKNFILER